LGSSAEIAHSPTATSSRCVRLTGDTNRCRGAWPSTDVSSTARRSGRRCRRSLTDGRRSGRLPDGVLPRPV